MNDCLYRAAKEFSLEIFRDEYPDLFTGGLLLHDGERVEWLSRGILGAPWHRVV